MKSEKHNFANEVLKQWKYIEFKYEQCIDNDNFNEIVRIFIYDKAIYLNKNMLISFMNLIDEAFTIQLDEIEVKIITMSYYHGYSNVKIMDELFITKSTFYRHKQKALEKLYYSFMLLLED